MFQALARSRKTAMLLLVVIGGLVAVLLGRLTWTAYLESAGAMTAFVSMLWTLEDVLGGRKRLARLEAERVAASAERDAANAKAMEIERAELIFLFEEELKKERRREAERKAIVELISRPENDLGKKDTP